MRAGTATAGLRRHVPTGPVVGACVLAFGVVGWQHVAHIGLGAALAPSEVAHAVRDGLLALPLAYVAVLAGVVLARRDGRTWAPRWCRTVGQWLAVAFIFAALLVPAAIIHGSLDGAVEGDPHPEAMAAIELEDESTLRHAMDDVRVGLLAVLPLAALAVALSSRSRHSTRHLAPARAAARPRFAGAALVLPTVVIAVGLASVSEPAAAAAPPPFTTPLPIPEVLDATAGPLAIEMVKEDVQILPGNPTTMWTYKPATPTVGTFPGPTIVARSGQEAKVTFTNKLPTEAGSMTVHNHGNHSRSSEDGQPEAFLIPPGGSRQYTWELMEDGVGERASTQWYHDHRMHVTGKNVWNGLAGFFIIEDDFEDALNLPKGPNREFDVPLMIADRTFDASNQIPYSFNMNGTLGDTILVNGAPQPYFEVLPRKYRFRVLNASNTRQYNLALSTGEAITQIGTESGLLPAPVARGNIPITPAERVEVVIDFAGRQGEKITLLNSGATGTVAQIMQFKVTTEAVQDTSKVPPTLRPVPALDAPSTTRGWEFDGGGLSPWTINGREFDSNRVDAYPKLGATEKWILRNRSREDHVVHIHDVDWKMVTRNGAPPPAEEAGLKESFLIRPGDVVEVVGKFTDHLGRYMIHCHVLEHEDMSMMAQFEVVLDSPPIASADSYTVNEGTALSVPAPGVLANDSDREADTLSAVLAGGPAHGTLDLRPDGSFTYTPTAGYVGPDAFTYRATAAGASSDVTSVALTVQAVTDPTPSEPPPPTEPNPPSEPTDPSGPDPSPSVPPDVAVRRLAGDDRIATAVAISIDGFAAGTAGAAVLARADQYPDAVVAAPLAAAQGGPVLLTPAASLDPRAGAELRRILPAGRVVFILGGPEAITDAVAAEVAGLGYEVRRVAGGNRFETSVAVARALGEPPNLLLATGRNFPDALTAGAAAVRVGGAVLLTDDASLPAPVAAYVSERAGAPRWGVGGQAAAADSGATPLVGADRYETGVAVARAFFPAPAVVGVATGQAFPDALAGGAHSGRQGAPLLLTERTVVPLPVRDYLASVRTTLTAAVIYGGPAAVGEEVAAALDAL